MRRDSILNDINTTVVTNIYFLMNKCEDVTIDEGEEIARELFEILNLRGDSYGLAANQFGIKKNVCVLNVKSPIYLINPKIVNPSGEIITFESCISFPEKRIRTKRYTTFTIIADNIDEEIYVDISGEQYSTDNLNIIEAIVLQHEISHLNGETIFDYEYVQPQLKNENKYQRNDKISISDGKNTIMIKYKNLDMYISKGYSIV